MTYFSFEIQSQIKRNTYINFSKERIPSTRYFCRESVGHVWYVAVACLQLVLKRIDEKRVDWTNYEKA